MNLMTLMDKHGMEFKTSLWLGDADAEEIGTIEYYPCDGDFTVDLENTRIDNVTLEDLKRLVTNIQDFIKVCETKVEDVILKV